MKKIVHLTSVHNRYDNRILIKECCSLAKVEGYDVHLIVADGLGHEEYESVTVIDLGKPKNRLDRMLRTVPKLYRVALREKADVYHFHDPELIVVGLLLCLAGRTVVYDIHEDYISGIRQKPYLNKYVAGAIAFLFDYLERGAARFFHLIIAERYYVERFPKSTSVLNYPIISERDLGELPIMEEEQTDFLYTIYAGNVTRDRGAIEHANAIANIEVLKLTSIGKCSEELADSMYNIAPMDRLQIIGVGKFVKPEDINTLYLSRRWHAGLALFPKTEHYAKKELTKFFEYMKFGLPIVCSDFPAWKEFVEDGQCGYAVDPNDTKRIEEILTLLKKDTMLRDSLGKNGRYLYLTKFNWAVEEQKLFALYTSILS